MRFERDIIKNFFIGLHVKHPYYCHVLMKLDFSGQFFKAIYSKIKVHENPSIGSPVVSLGRRDRWTDGHDETNSCFFAVFLI